MYRVLQNLIRVHRSRYIIHLVDPRLKILIFIIFILLSYYDPIRLAISIASTMITIGLVEYRVKYIYDKSLTILIFASLVGFIVAATPPDPIFSSEALKSGFTVFLLILSIGMCAVILLQSIRYIDLYMMLERGRLKPVALIYIVALRSLSIVGKLLSSLIDSIRIYESRSRIKSYIKVFSPSKLEPLIHTLIVYSSYMGYYIEIRTLLERINPGTELNVDRKIDLVFTLALTILLLTIYITINILLKYIDIL